jgi:hypothetical protein
LNRLQGICLQVHITITVTTRRRIIMVMAVAQVMGEQATPVGFMAAEVATVEGDIIDSGIQLSEITNGFR